MEDVVDAVDVVDVVGAILEMRRHSRMTRCYRHRGSEYVQAGQVQQDDYYWLMICKLLR